jgi:hypothetical protein
MLRHPRDFHTGTNIFICVYIFCLSQLLWSPNFISTSLQTKLYHAPPSVIHNYTFSQISVPLSSISTSGNFVTKLTFRFGYPTIFTSCKHAPLPLQSCTCSLSYNQQQKQCVSLLLMPGFIKGRTYFDQNIFYVGLSKSRIPQNCFTRECTNTRPIVSER